MTSPAVAEYVRQVDDSSRLDNPVNLAGRLSERPYLSSATYLRDRETYPRRLAVCQDEMQGYDAR